MTPREWLQALAAPMFRRKSNEAQAHYDEAQSTPEPPTRPVTVHVTRRTVAEWRPEPMDDVPGEYGIRNEQQEPVRVTGKVNRVQGRCITCGAFCTAYHVCVTRHSHRDARGRFARRPTDG